MRGKVWFESQNTTGYRITPAYAGKSLTTLKIDKFERDHPRLCGEKSLMNRSSGTILGSPPPMRGKAGTGKTTTASVGITPAYAGKRLKRS